MKDKLDKSNVQEILELTTVQRGMLFHFLNEANKSVYNVQLSFRIEGELNVNTLKQAITVVQSQNESLRSVFRWEKISKPLQIILKESPVHFIYRDLSHEQSESIQHLVEQYSEDDRHKRFTLTETPFRVVVIKTSAELYILNITHHHILYEGWSTGILLEELFTCYKQIEDTGFAGVKAKPAYKEMHQYLVKHVKEGAESYWEKYLQNYDVTSFFSNSGKAQQENEIAKVTKRVSNTRMDVFASSNKVTKASVVYAAYGMLLQKHYDISDVVFGTTVSNRDVPIKGSDRVIGNFINTIPLRINHLEDSTLLDITTGVSKDLIGRSRYNNTSYFEIKRILDLKPNSDLFDSVVIIENYPLKADRINNNVKFKIHLDTVYENTGIPLIITVFFHEEIELEFAYQTDCLSESFVRSFAKQFVWIIDNILTNHSKKVKDISLLSDHEKSQLLYGFNKTALEYPTEKTLVQLFEEQVSRTPSLTALVFGEQALTYKELNEKANSLAAEIRAKGIGPNQIVALHTSRSLELYISLFAVLKSGGCYLPLDPTFPKERLEYMMSDAGASVLITTPDFEEITFNVEHDFDILTVDCAELAQQVKNLSHINSPEDLAYVIYTSGSTGRPKGVMLPHRAVHNYIVSLAKSVPFTVDTSIVSVTTFSFDIFVTESLVPLTQGAKVVVADEAAQKDPRLLFKIVALNGATMMQTTPSRYKLLTNYEAAFQAGMEQMKYLLVGGEALPPELLKQLKANSGARIINVYGPTETTVWSSLIDLTDEDKITIGRPIGNTQFYVLNKHRQLQPKGVNGELYIGGDGLAKGYWNNSELTDKVFVPNPFNNQEKLYKTGDLVRWLDNGTIEYLGRTDFQVKIRGHRVEAGEIESHLSNYGFIDECLVLAREVHGNNHLVAYYVSGKEVEVNLLKGYLSERLPTYMVPSYFVAMDRLPTTPNGKLDKTKLPKPEIKINKDHVVPSGEIEKQLFEIWKEVLGHDKISANQNFFDVGGDSLHLISVSSKIKLALNEDISVTELFNYTTIHALAKFINRRNGDLSKEISGEDIREVGRLEERITSFDIAIIGMSGRFPDAQNTDEFWKNLQSGKESIARKKGEGHDPLIYAKGILEGYESFDAAFFSYTPSEAAKMDPQMRIFHECTWEALENAGYNPNTYNGAIGLYGGASANPYYNINVGTHGEDDWVEKWEAITYADKDFLCPRVSYKLNLKGPSVNIATACSTSLVAVDTACHELLAGKCDMALAGGVSVSLHDNEGYTYRKGMILSSDGSCRAFDATSTGTVSGNGAGIVVLKKLSDAVRDGDNIHAVIKGTSTNNDGHEKIGFTAPSVDGQSEAIRKAIYSASIEPESISYIEAHGTGTALGDPLEIAGLTKAFGTRKKQFCAIGSVKTNIGHLDAAAGIAGLIKTVLSLKNKQLVPSLHYKTPNASIDFKESPFYVNVNLQEWKKGKYPRRAGVSSFGIGGTNAHVILEEAPDFADASASRDHQLLTISAKTPIALQKNVKELASFLEEHRDVKLPDVAYTLQMGREHFPIRRTVCCNGPKEAVKLLKGQSDHDLDAFSSGKVENIVFMFSGQGSQYSNMCADLYAKEIYFREVVDKCLEIVKEISGEDLKPVMFGEAVSVETDKINHTEYTQPALFTIEYALAQLLIKWGIKPTLVIGHSIGEYVAACVGGMFSLKDALKLVVNRGKLMQQVAPGAMLSISIEEDELLPLMGDDDNISLAAVNSSMHCVVSGADESVHAFKKKIDKIGYTSKIIRTSHAFHSYMMDDILDNFKEIIASIKFEKQQIPLVSNLTGKIISEENLASPDYWTRHLRETVRFSEGVSRIMEAPEAVLIEVGPGNVLSTLVRSHRNRLSSHEVISIVRHPKQNADDQQYLLDSLGKLWTRGIEINWNELYRGERRKRVALPTYSFDKVKFPVRIDERSDKQTENESIRKNDIEEWLYVPNWKSTVSISGKKRNNASYVIIGDNNRLQELLSERFSSEHINYVSILKGNSYEKSAPNQYVVNTDTCEDFTRLFRSLIAEGFEYDHIIYDGTSSEPIAVSDGNRVDYHADFYDLIQMVKSAHSLKNLSEKHITLVTSNLYNVLGDEKVDDRRSSLLGIIKVIAQEYPVTTGHIDLAVDEIEKTATVNLLIDEFAKRENGLSLALRNSRRWEQSFEQITVQYENSVLKKSGVYLITGGLGKLGFTLAQYLTTQYQANVILLGRTTLPAIEQWKSYLRNVEEDSDIAVKIGRMQQLNSGSGEVRYFDCDISNLLDLKEAVETAERQYGPISGIIHTAGILQGKTINLIDRLTQEDFREQFKAKFTGIYNLNQVTGSKKLDFCLAISSISSVLGGLQFGAYASANVAMDHYINALWESNCSPHWVSVNLDGLAFDDNRGEGIKTAELRQVFERVAYLTSLPQVVVSVGDLNDRVEQWIKNNVSGPNADDVKVITSNDSIEVEMIELWKEYFGIDKIRLSNDFFELGGDSLKVLTMIGRIHKKFNVELSTTEFFEYPTVKELSSYLSALIEQNRRGKSEYIVIPPVETSEYYPLSSVQRRLYFLHEFDKTSVAYNMPLTLKLSGKIDHERLKNVFTTLIERHEPLRTRFDIIDDQPYQRITRQFDFKINYYTSGEDASLALSNFVRPFDLTIAPLIRVGLIKISEEEHILVVDVPHIITDGVSKSVLIKDFMALYKGQLLDELKLHYKDYAVWQQSKDFQQELMQQKGFWMREFLDDITPLNLPTDYVRPAVKRYDGAIKEFEISKTNTEKLRRLAENEGATLFTVLLSAYTILLSKLSNQVDIVVGTPVSGRQHTDLEQMMGMFINTLPLRNCPQGDLRFVEFMAEVKAKTLACFDHQSYPYEELIDELQLARDTSRNPLFDVLFSFENFERSVLEIPELKVTPHNNNHIVSKFDLTLTAFEHEGVLSLTFEYCTGLFTPQTIERFIGYFGQVVSTILSDVNVKLSAITLLSVEESSLILHRFNDTALAFDSSRSLVSAFESQVAKKASFPALRHEGVVLSYGELNEQSNQLAHRILEEQLPAEAVVGILLPRSPAMIISMLGVLKAGCCYVPLDPHYPEERIDYIIRDSGLSVLLTTAALQAQAQRYADQVATIDVTSGSLSEQSTVNPGLPIAPSQLAYMIYTSGSTGRPKGVMIEHGNVLNFVEGIAQRIAMGADSRLLCLTTISFDIFVLESLLPLLRGYQIVLAGHSEQKDPSALGQLIQKEGVNKLQITPSHLKMLLSSEGVAQALQGIDTLMVGGERFPMELLVQVRSCYQGRIYNMYGPTETTVWSSVQELTSAQGVDIGRPLANTTVVVVDQEGHLQPVGVAGELYIGGAGVGRGYWGKEALTSERFVSGPASTSGRFYRSGDLGRWLANGAIEYLGRKDNQVKIRGFRIEPAEIESQLLVVDQISEAVVCAQGEVDEAVLVAYYVSAVMLEPSELRAHLSERLPDYMIPAYFMHLGCLPLTPNGKLDRPALPTPELVSRVEYVGASNAVEEQLVGLWSEVLRLSPEGISVTRSFFELGGNSLKATVLANKIHKKLHTRVPLSKIFQHQDIRSLGQYITTEEKSTYRSIEKAPEQEYYSSSSAQKRLYVLHQLSRTSMAYNMFYTVRLTGALDRAKLDKAFANLINRHESLRTSFHVINDQPVQRIIDQVDFEVCYYQSDEAGVETLIHSFIQPFDLTTSPLIRAGVIAVSQEDHILAVDMHHIITDGTSQGILMQDFTNLYNEEELTPLALQYKDFAEWQHTIQPATVLRQKAFWVNEFAEDVTSLELPTDTVRPLVRSNEGGSMDFTLSTAETSRLNALSKEEGTTLFMLMLSIYNVLLSKLSNQEDIVVGTPVAGRRHADLERVVGMLVNTLPLRNYPSGEQTFREFLHTVKERALACFEHQDYPYEELIGEVKANRAINRNPLFDVMFVFQNQEENEAKMSGLKLTPYHGVHAVSKFDLTLTATEQTSGMHLSFEYSADLFMAQTILRFIDYFKRIVQSISSDINQRLSAIEIVPEKEKHQLLHVFNNNKVDYPQEETIVTLFEKQVTLNPHNIALIYENQRVSYKDLDAMANSIAYAVSGRVPIGNHRVGLLFNASIEMIASMLGVMKAGCAYVPLSPEAPVERNDYALSDCEAQLLLVQEGLDSDNVKFDAKKIVIVDEKLIVDNVADAMKKKASPNDLIYVIYTSGTTGLPKGVEVEHKGIVNYISWRISNFEFTSDDVTMQMVSYHFDGYGGNLYSLLLSGGAAILMSNEDRLNARHLAKTITVEKVSYVGMTPAILEVVLTELKHEQATSLRLIVLAGEGAKPELLQKSQKILPNTRICNEYGPTETSIGAACNNHLHENNTSIIGKPINNTSVYVLGQKGDLLPMGVYGELCIAGVGVARGYVNNETLTREKFVDNPFRPGEKMYKTGDLSRWTPNGEIEFLGRVDNQVKIRGFRVEPKEIEIRLNKHSQIKDTVVLTRERGGDKFLVAYYVAEAEIEPNDIRTYLSDKVPDYMIPSYYVQMKSMPIGSNGKVDKKALPEPELTLQEYVAASTETEKKLVEIWSDILRMDESLVSINDNFFDLGGHSLRATVLANRIFRELNVEIPLQEIFISNTIEMISEYIENERWAKEEPSSMKIVDEVILD